MFYKFIGGDEASLLDVFDMMTNNGSLKFASAAHFNDPFEFKFVSVAPTRSAFDAWHAAHDHGRSREEIENAWDSFSGVAADWNTNWVPRLGALGQLYVLCLARRWDSHLMWSHYARDHKGFAVIFKQDIVKALEAHEDHAAMGNVTYQDWVAELRWFEGQGNQMFGPLLFTKSAEWAYEREFRLVVSGEAHLTAVFATVDPALIAGVILGARASPALIERALVTRKTRPDFIVQQISSRAGSYELESIEKDDNVRRMGHIL